MEKLGVFVNFLVDFVCVCLIYRLRFNFKFHEIEVLKVAGYILTYVQLKLHKVETYIFDNSGHRVFPVYYSAINY